MAGTAAKVANGAAACGRIGEPVEQCAVGGFVSEFVEDAAGVFFGEAVVVFANGVGVRFGHGLANDRGEIEQALAERAIALNGGLSKG